MVPVRNLILSSFGKADMEGLKSFLERVHVDQGEFLIRARRPITHVYFPEGGIASILSARSGERRAEVAVIGREGLCGAAALLMAESAAHDIVLQVESAWMHRVATEPLLKLMDESASVRRTILRFVQALFVQIASNSVANLSDKLDLRLARWLLMCHDRVDDNVISITHDFTAILIGSQRSAVTTALHVLEGDRLIQAGRGFIRILDREGMEARANGTYGFAEAEYRRLIAPFGKSSILKNVERDENLLSKNRPSAVATGQVR